MAFKRSINKPTRETYHVGHRKHVETPYDKHSALYHPELWNWHDIYDQQVSYKGSVVTRSQTAFSRIGVDESDMKLFGEKMRHHPPDLPHLMMTMKDGTYGAIPRTIITRSMANELETNPTLTKTLEAYKSFKPLEALSQQERKPSMMDRLFKKDKNEEKEVVKDGIRKYPPSPKLHQASPSNNGPVRYIERLKNCATTTPSGEKRPLLRESKFSQEVLDSLSHVKAPFSAPDFSKMLKDPSFIVTQNSYTIPPAKYPRLESQSRRENQECQVSFTPISFGGSRVFSLPFPGSRVPLSNQVNTFPKFNKQPPFLMFK